MSCLPHCWDSLSEKTRRSAIDRQKQIELAKARNQPHPIGRNYRALDAHNTEAQPTETPAAEPQHHEA
jgi:UPF0176 protein